MGAGHGAGRRLRQAARQLRQPQQEGPHFGCFFHAGHPKVQVAARRRAQGPSSSGAAGFSMSDTRAGPGDDELRPVNEFRVMQAAAGMPMASQSVQRGGSRGATIISRAHGTIACGDVNHSFGETQLDHADDDRFGISHAASRQPFVRLARPRHRVPLKRHGEW